MSIALIITLIILGIICLVLELLVIPGGIVGIIGFLMMVGGVIGAYTYSVMIGNIVTVSTVIITIFAVVMMLRSKTWRTLMLKTNIDSKVNEIDEEKVIVGMSGIAISRLAPMGKGKFDSEVVEVSSIHGFIDVQSEIVITKIEGNKIFVKLK